MRQQTRERHKQSWSKQEQVSDKAKRGGEKRDSQGRVRAEVLGGRSKAVISW